MRVDASTGPAPNGSPFSLRFSAKVGRPDFEKSPFALSRKLRERKRLITGKKVEGRKSHAELHPEVVALVRQLRRRRPKGGQRSLRDISAELAQRGIVNERGRPFSAASINSMLQK